MAKQTQKPKSLNLILQEQGFNLIAHISNKLEEIKPAMERFSDEISRGLYEDFRIVPGRKALEGSGYELVHGKTFFYVKFSKINPMYGRTVADIGFATVRKEGSSQRISKRIIGL